MGVTFPNESPNYRDARNRLLQREAALRREMESVPRKSVHSRRAGVCSRIMSSTILMRRALRPRFGSPSCFDRAPTP